MNNKRNSLREAEARAKDAEARYRRLVSEADSHKASAAEAAKASKNYAGQYQARCHAGWAVCGRAARPDGGLASLSAPGHLHWHGSTCCVPRPGLTARLCCRAT